MDWRSSKKTALAAVDFVARRAHPAAIAIAIVGVVASLMRPSFLVVDNVAFSDWAREGYIAPGFGAVYSIVIHALTTGVGDFVNWYGALLFAGHAVSLSLLIVTVRRIVPTSALIAALAALIAGYLIFLVYLDYTSTSFMLSASALAWICVHLAQGTETRVKLLAAGVFIMAAGMFRYQPPALMLALASPLVALALYGRVSGEKTRRLVVTATRAVGAYAAISLLYVAAVAADQGYKRYWSPPDYREFQTFYNLRGRLHGFPILQANRGNEELLARLNWTPDDYNRFARWMFFDETTYNADTLHVFLDPRYAIQNSDIARDSTAIDSLKFLSDYSGLYLLLLAVLFASAARSGARSRGALCVLLVVAGCVVSSGYLSNVLRFPIRLGWPLLSASLIFAFTAYRLAPPAVYTGLARRMRRQMFLGKGTASVGAGPIHFTFVAYRPLLRTARAGRAFGRYPMLLGAALSVAAGAIIHMSALQQESARRDALEASYIYARDMLNDVLADKPLLIQLGQALREEFRHPLAPVNSAFLRINVGWATFSPRFYDQIADLGLSRGADLYTYFLDNPDAFVIADASWARLFVTRLEERGLAVRAVQSRRLYPGSTIWIYRIRTIPPLDAPVDETLGIP